MSLTSQSYFPQAPLSKVREHACFVNIIVQKGKKKLTLRVLGPFCQYWVVVWCHCYWCCCHFWACCIVSRERRDIEEMLRKVGDMVIDVDVDDVRQSWTGQQQINNKQHPCQHQSPLTLRDLPKTPGDAWGIGHFTKIPGEPGATQGDKICSEIYEIT